MLISCKNCRKIYESDADKEFACRRCGHTVRARDVNTLQISLALTVSAIMFYIPAMVYPMMEITQFGVTTKSTIIGGVMSFLEHKDYFIASVIFIASVAIPLVKLIGLLFIFASLKINTKLSNKMKINIFRFIEFIGKWSMVDVYVVAILASAMQLGEVFNIKGGLAATSFCLVVAFTMIAAKNFDTRIIWDDGNDDK